MPRYVQRRDGTMAGSIGDGKATVPTVSDVPATGQSTEDPAVDVAALHSRFAAAKSGRGGTPVVPGRNDLASARPDLAGLASGWDPAGVAVHDDVDRAWRCQAGHDFTDTPANVAGRKTACPYCAGRRAIPGQTDLATTHPDLAALAHGWDPQTVLVRDGTERDWRCVRGHEFTASPGALAARRNVCLHPDCRATRGGFNREEPGHLYVLHAVRDGHVVVQYGITNNLAGRLTQHRMSGFVDDPILVRSFDHGGDAADLETQIKRFQAALGIPTSTQAGDVFDGSTEAFRLADAGTSDDFLPGFQALVAASEAEDTDVARSFATLRAALDVDSPAGQSISRESAVARVGLILSAGEGSLDDDAIAAVPDKGLRATLREVAALRSSEAFARADAVARQRQEIYTLADGGMDPSEVATSLGLRPGRVEQVLAIRARDERIVSDFQAALAADTTRDTARHGRQRLLAQVAAVHQVGPDTVRRVVAEHVPNTRKARLSARDKDTILALAKTTPDVEAIAAKTGVSTSSVYAVLTKAGARTRIRVSDSTPDILARQAAGQSVEQIAAEVGGTVNSVRKVLRKSGVDLAARKTVESDVRKAHALALSAKGMSEAEIRQQTGMSASHLSRVLKGAGATTPAARRRAERDEAIRAYKKANPAASLTEVMAATGQSKSTVHRALTGDG